MRGEVFEARITEVNQDRLDNNAVKELLTEEQLKSVTKTISFKQMRVTRISGEKPEFKMPNLDNATPEGLVDMLGDIKEQIKDLEKLEGIYKTALEARMEDQDD
jgi:hypothetical protein